MLSQTRAEVHSGVLRGNGLKSRCRVSVVLKGANDQLPVVFEYQILSVEKSLPDGDYNLLLHWETVNVRLQNGEWSAPVS